VGCILVIHSTPLSVCQHSMASPQPLAEILGAPSPPPTHRKRSPSPSTFRKPCAMCSTPSDVLVRCRIDSTATWHLVCPKKCWKEVSGGVVDGDPDHTYYQYGGMWKNKHALVSAKKPKAKKGKEKDTPEWQANEKGYLRNDRVRWEGKVWVCRSGHESGKANEPCVGYRFWKEAD